MCRSIISFSFLNIIFILIVFVVAAHLCVRWLDKVYFVAFAFPTLQVFRAQNVLGIWKDIFFIYFIINGGENNLTNERTKDVLQIDNSKRHYCFSHTDHIDSFVRLKSFSPCGCGLDKNVASHNVCVIFSCCLLVWLCVRVRLMRIKYLCIRETYKTPANWTESQQCLNQAKVKWKWTTSMSSRTVTLWACVWDKLVRQMRPSFVLFNIFSVVDTKSRNFGIFGISIKHYNIFSEAFLVVSIRLCRIHISFIFMSIEFKLIDVMKTFYFAVRSLTVFLLFKFLIGWKCLILNRCHSKLLIDSYVTIREINFRLVPRINCILLQIFDCKQWCTLTLHEEAHKSIWLPLRLFVTL